MAMQNDPQVSPRTRETYTESAWRIFRFGQTHGWPMNVAKLEPCHYMEYYQTIQGLASMSQATYMNAFTQLLHYAKNPYADQCRLKLRPVRGEVYWAERHQVIRLFQTAPSPRILAAEVVFSYTGIREMEARQLRERSLTDKWLIVQVGKRQKGRRIPVDEEFWQMLEPYVQWKDRYETKWGSSDYFIVHPEDARRMTGELVPYAAGGLSGAMVRHGLSLEPPIPHMNAHSLRRYFGRSLYEAGCPATQIQGYYGHSTLQQTMDYIGITDEMSWDAMAKYRPKYLDDYRNGLP